MRLFVALDVNDAVREVMRQVRRSLDERLRAEPHAPRLTWVSPDVAHVTLHFIGEVDDVRAARIAETLRNNLEGPPFDVTWHELGVFPSARAPRAVWIGAENAAVPLAALADQVQRRLEPLVGRPDTRPFRAHLTVARVRDRAPRLNWTRLLGDIDVDAVASRVEHVTLYRSALSSRGPAYTAMARAHLA